MVRGKQTRSLLVGMIIVMLALGGLQLLRIVLSPQEARREGNYQSLPTVMKEADPLEHLGEDFVADEDFHSNLPLVILNLDGEVTQYKGFENSEEFVEEDVTPWTEGSIQVLDRGEGDNFLADTPVYTSRLRIKKRGHTSFSYDKPQYLMKMVDGQGLENNTPLLGMGEGHSWILNGSMADKSMLRNYLPYRIASEIGGGNMAPDSRFCEVFLCKDGVYEYQGVYLLMETVARGTDRVDIDQSKTNKSYTSYIVRRDRFTHFDVMLDTYGRLQGYSPEWIGVKYPSQAKLTETAKKYIENDFSAMERILYAEEESTFKAYDKYIDVDSFVDYFLINEFFGNYDAGEHSTYMYKNTGERLHIGPVWDFDQAMNNYFGGEMEPETLAFQTKPLFDRLTKDERFLRCLKDRYAELRKGALSEKHIYAVMDEVTGYLKNAREREWYRWAADYMDGSFTNPHNYYLQDYEKDDRIISRFNDRYDQELYIIRTYFHKHGQAIQTELSKLEIIAVYDTSIRNENELLLLILLSLFLIPSLLINRKG